MKINIKAFTIAFVIAGTLPALLLFIGCSVNGFGAEIVRLFESVHPSGGFSIIENIDNDIGIKVVALAVNVVYTIADCFIMGFGFAALYNIILVRFGGGNKG